MDRKKNRQELEDFLRDVLNRITSSFEVDEAILYGSYAKGNAHEFSDVDLAIVSPDLKKRSMFANNRFIKTRIKLYEADLQLSSFPSELFYNETFIDPGFVREIKSTGKKIYHKDKGLDFSSL